MIVSHLADKFSEMHENEKFKIDYIILDEGHKLRPKVGNISIFFTKQNE